MSSLQTANDGIKINKAKDTFMKKIPFKVYQLLIQGKSQPVHTHDYMQIWYVMNGYAQHYIPPNQTII